MQGARQIDERRRTKAVRWSEAVKRNEAGGPFSPGYLPLDHVDESEADPGDVGH